MEVAGAQSEKELPNGWMMSWIDQEAPQECERLHQRARVDDAISYSSITAQRCAGIDMDLKCELRIWQFFEPRTMLLFAFVTPARSNHSSFRVFATTNVYIKHRARSSTFRRRRVEYYGRTSRNFVLDLCRRTGSRSASNNDCAAAGVVNGGEVAPRPSTAFNNDITSFIYRAISSHTELATNLLPAQHVCSNHTAHLPHLLAHTRSDSQQSASSPPSSAPEPS